MRKFTIKRIFDSTTSIILLILLAPGLLVIGLAIKLNSRGPILFKQERIGRCFHPFTIVKFRTMKYGTENETMGRYISEKNPQITKIGIFLRRWGLDELPQILNIIKGDMSLVGPRPTMRYQTDKYDKRQSERLKFKPGITGWAQVNGRNILSWPERIELDLWYVDNWSIWLDFKIMIMTIPALIRKEFAFAREDAGNDEIVSFTQQKDL